VKGNVGKGEELWEEFENPDDSEPMSLDKIPSDAESDIDNGDGTKDRSVEKKHMRTKCPRITDCPLFPQPPFPTAGQVKALLDSADYEMKGSKSADRMRRVIHLRKSKVFDNEFNSSEQNEKGLDVVVGIDMLLVMVFHQSQGVTMIGMMPTTLVLNTTVKRCVVSRRCNFSNRRHTCTARSCLSLGQLTHTSNFPRVS